MLKEILVNKGPDGRKVLQRLTTEDTIYLETDLPKGGHAEAILGVDGSLRIWGFNSGEYFHKKFGPNPQGVEEYQRRLNLFK